MRWVAPVATRAFASSFSLLQGEGRIANQRASIAQYSGLKPIYRGSVRALAWSRTRLASGPRCAVLYYHSIGDDGLSVPVSSFRATVETIWQSGYQTINLRDLVAWINGELSLPSKVCAISFDDCFESVYTHALPILREYGMTATCFVTTDYVNTDDVREHQRQLVRRPYIRWDQIGELVSYGMEIGGHTRTHRNLTDLSQDEVEWEVRSSREILQDRLGVPVDVFAYPRGRFSREIAEEVRKAGFLGAVTTLPGINTRTTCSLFLKRYGAGRMQGRILLDGLSGLSAAREPIYQSWLARRLRRLFSQRA